MGNVYKVHNTKIKEKIALKLIKPEIAGDKKTIERFSNELRLARKIRHKNICQMFDLGETIRRKNCRQEMGALYCHPSLHEYECRQRASLFL